MSRTALNWWIATAVTLVLILGPFLVAGEAVDAWILERLETDDGIAGLVIGSLALDAVLPIPSSIVSIAAGARLGFWTGWLCVSVGMSLGSMLGYAVGRQILRRSLAAGGPAPSVASGQPLAGDWRALWFLALTRPIPVLAEAATVLLGYRGMKLTRFLGTAIAANIVVGAMYAAAGEWAASLGSTWMILVVLVCLSSLPWFGYLFLRRRKFVRSNLRR